MGHAAVGTSLLESSSEAGAQAAWAARDRLGGDPACAIVYGTVFYDQRALLRAVREVFGGVPIVGCSTQGIAHRGGVDEVDRVVGVAAIGGASIRAESAHAEGIAADPRGAGRRLAAAVGGRRDAPLLLWYDPLSGADVAALIAGLAEGGRPVVIAAARASPGAPSTGRSSTTAPRRSATRRWR